jgi:hypothetical protein
VETYASESGDKSPMREPVNPKKLGRAKFVKIRVTKLLRDSSLILGVKCNITGKDLFLV